MLNFPEISLKFLVNSKAIDYIFNQTVALFEFNLKSKKQLKIAKIVENHQIKKKKKTAKQLLKSPR